MENLAQFNFEGNEVRSIVDEKGDPWFVAKDVCNVLGLNNVGEAISRLRDKDKYTIPANIISADVALKGGRDPFVISEFGLYELVLSSRKENAQKFKYWICDEVIPSIRKTGSYSVQPKSPAEFLVMLANQLLEQERKTKEHDQKILQIEEKQRSHEIEIDDMKNGSDHFSITAYNRVFRKYSIPNKEALDHGKRLTKICKENDFPVGQVPHPVWGRVNTYPKALLDEFYKSLLDIR